MRPHGSGLRTRGKGSTAMEGQRLRWKQRLEGGSGALASWCRDVHELKGTCQSILAVKNLYVKIQIYFCVVKKMSCTHIYIYIDTLCSNNLGWSAAS